MPVILLPLLLVVYVVLNLGVAQAATPAKTSPDIERIRNELSRSRAELSQATAECSKALSELQPIDSQIKVNETKLAMTESKLTAVQEELSKRITCYYKAGPANTIQVILSSKNYSDFIKRVIFAALIFSQDSKAAAKVKALREELKRETLALNKAKQEKLERLAEVKRRQSQISSNLLAQSAALARLNRQTALPVNKPTARVAMALGKPLGSTYVSRGNARSGFVFPVVGQYSYIDSWGFSRSGGRRHQGCDIMAATGTPLIACVPGTIKRTSPYPRSLGGITIWLDGDDGYTYYYAHLSRIAGHITPGRRVNSGDLLGYVGSSGNADASAPHLHFEIHRPDGSPINPYPTLSGSDPKNY